MSTNSEREPPGGVVPVGEDRSEPPPGYEIDKGPLGRNFPRWQKISRQWSTEECAIIDAWNDHDAILNRGVASGMAACVHWLRHGSGSLSATAAADDIEAGTAAMPEPADALSKALAAAKEEGRQEAERERGEWWAKLDALAKRVVETHGEQAALLEQRVAELEAEGIARERAAVVAFTSAWMTETNKVRRGARLGEIKPDGLTACLVASLANAIERGDHHPEHADALQRRDDRVRAEVLAAVAEWMHRPECINLPGRHLAFELVEAPRVYGTKHDIPGADALKRALAEAREQGVANERAAWQRMNEEHGVDRVDLARMEAEHRATTAALEQRVAELEGELDRITADRDAIQDSRDVGRQQWSEALNRVSSERDEARARITELEATVSRMDRERDEATHGQR